MIRLLRVQLETLRIARAKKTNNNIYERNLRESKKKKKNRKTVGAVYGDGDGLWGFSPSIIIN